MRGHDEKNTSMLIVQFLSCITLKRSARVICKNVTRKVTFMEVWRCLFYLMPFYGEAMHMRNMGMSFFVVCPLRNCECMAPKIGMNCTQSLKILFLFDSSRFSGQLSRIYKGIPKKDISMFQAKRDISMPNV